LNPPALVALAITQVILKEGVVGGFAPAVVRLEVKIKGNEITVSRLKTRTYHPKPEDYQEVKGNLPNGVWDQLNSSVSPVSLPTMGGFWSDGLFLEGRCWIILVS